MDPQDRTLRLRLTALLALVGLLSALLLSWAHPVELQRQADHDCAGGTHVSRGHDDPCDHDESACPLCDLAQGAAVAPDLGGPALLAPSPLGELARASSAAERGPPLLGFDSRGPPV